MDHNQKKEFWENFSKKNMERCLTAFAPGHTNEGFILCMLEELGELSAAWLGVSGQKKRKAHLTNKDVLDAIADLATYVDLYATQTLRDFEVTPSSIADTLENEDSLNELFTLDEAAISSVQQKIFWISKSINSTEGFDALEIGITWFLLNSIATDLGANFEDLLKDTFNFVSDRAGCDIKIA